MSLSKYEALPPISSNRGDDNLTNYRVDYHPHPLEKPFVHKQDDYVKPAGDMEKMTSYKQEYVGT